MARSPKPPADEADEESRLHYIPEWAEHLHMRQVDIVDGLNGLVDKSTVSRWFSGTLPSQEHLEALRSLFDFEDVRTLFRHPDDDWLRRFMRDRSEDERFAIRQTLEAAFSKRKAG